MQGGLILLLAVIFLFVGSVPSLAYDYSGYNWSTTYTYYNANQISNTSWQAAINTAGGYWNAAGSSFDFIIYDYATNIWETEYLGHNGRIAQSYVSIYEGYITDCDTRFNTYYSFHTDGSNYDVLTVALHEFGHWLMLKDLYSGSDSDKVMYWAYNGIKRDLTSDDINGIKYIYGEE